MHARNIQLTLTSRYAVDRHMLDIQSTHAVDHLGSSLHARYSVDTRMSLTALLRKRKLAVALIEKKEELLAAPPQPAPQRARFSSASAAADDTVFNLSSDEEAEEGKPLGGFLLSRVGIDVPMAQHYMDFVKDGNIFPSVR